MQHWWYQGWTHQLSSLTHILHGCTIKINLFGFDVSCEVLFFTSKGISSAYVPLSYCTCKMYITHVTTSPARAELCTTINFRVAAQVNPIGAVGTFGKPCCSLCMGEYPTKNPSDKCDTDWFTTPIYAGGVGILADFGVDKRMEFLPGLFAPEAGCCCCCCWMLCWYIPSELSLGLLFGVPGGVLTQKPFYCTFEWEFVLVWGCCLMSSDGSSIHLDGRGNILELWCYDLEFTLPHNLRQLPFLLPPPPPIECNTTGRA